MQQDARWQAVDAAYRGHAEDVYRVAFAILHEADAAADVTQETFARAYRAWDRYDPGRPLRPWLQAIAARLALDGLRRQRVRRLAAPILASRQRAHAEEADRGPGILAGHSVEEALARLRPRARAAVVLRHYYGYDYEEIAALLATTPGNVGALLSRAHADLRELLQEVVPVAATVGEQATRR